MADKKLSELPLTSVINAEDISLLVSDGTDYKFAFGTLLQFMGNNLNIGAKISVGTVLPSNSTGKNGDLFIKTDTGVFAQKVSGVWTVVYTIPSATGVTSGTILYGVGAPGSGAGNDNDTYINTGTGIFYKKTAGSWSQVFSMQTGPQGPQGTAGTNGINGANGFSVLNGTTTPSNISIGVNGDFYINTSTYTIYGPKTGGVWGDGMSLIGTSIPNGGTTGQVIVKTSNDDFDADWGDIDVAFENLTGDVTDNASLSAALDGKADLVAGKVPSAQLPSYVDDVLEFSDFAALPGVGEANKIYVTLNDNYEYRWSGSTYIQLVASPGSTDAVPEGTTNRYFTAARVLASLLTGIGFGSAAAVAATDSVLTAFGKLQKQISNFRDLIVTSAIAIPNGFISINNAGLTLGSFFNAGGIKVITGDGSTVDGTANFTEFSKNLVAFRDLGTYWQEIRPNNGTLTGNGTFRLPNKTGDKTLATLDDITGGVGGVGDYPTDIEADTIKLSSPQSVFSGGHIYFLGTSITAGYGASATESSFTSLIALTLGGLTQHNYGAPGKDATDTDLSNIPTKSATDRYLCIEYGTNEVINHGGTFISDSVFHDAMQAIIDNAISKGWSGSNIILLSTFGCTYSEGSYTTVRNALLAKSAVTSGLANTYGTFYVDCFDPMFSLAGPECSADFVHPSNLGHSVISQLILSGIPLVYNITNQKQVVNGIGEFKNLVLRSIKTISGKSAHKYLLGVDTNGSVGQINSVKDGIELNKTYLAGSLIARGTTPPTAMVQGLDHFFANQAKLIGGFNSTLYNYIQLGDAGLSMIFGTTYGGKFIFKNSAGAEIITMNGDGTVTVPLELQFPINKGLKAFNGLGYGKLLLFNDSGNTVYENGYPTGRHIWKVLDGGSGTNTKTAAVMFASGRLLIEFDGSATDIPSARFAINSTTEGFLPPRMTATQRDAISSPAEGLEIYNLTTHKKNFFNGTSWEVITSA